ncbi:MAG: hypothetical protein KJN90_05155 [Gammaproteobacteria bacterium]|nr:hypothetical protein [Gammaproteobacteria bacterium]
MSNAFEFKNCPYPIREDIQTEYGNFWERLSRPGSWWTGKERVAIAEESRAALACEHCIQRKEALSPNSVAGEHQTVTDLPEAAVDAVHRIITDQTRITRQWVEGLPEQGISTEAYVELTGIVVCVFSIDEFHRALGLEIEPLPEPQSGSPDHYRPPQAESGAGFVPMLPREGLTGKEADLWPGGRSANVIRALSLVPAAVKDWLAVSSAQYLPVTAMGNYVKHEGRAINRMQMELVASRVSAINECFY